MQSLLLTMLALIGAIGMASGGSSGSSQASLSNKKYDPTSPGTSDDGDSGGNPSTTPTTGGDVPTITQPTAPEQDVDTSDGGGTAPVDASGGSYTVSGGRVTTLRLEDSANISSVRVLEGPAQGNLTVNPDNTLALVLSHDHDFTGTMAMRYEVTYDDGRTEVFDDSVSVAPTTQGAGWGGGEFYMLETDENGDVVVEAGANHREVYVSGSDDALSLSDIAAMEGLSTSQITGNWLRAHPEYGGSEGMALDAEAGMRVWYEITGFNGSETNAPSSDWLLFEAGYEYSGIGGVLNPLTMGEDPLHPIHVTSYGSGSKPILDTQLIINNNPLYDVSNVVFSDIQVTGGAIALTGSNLMFDDVYFSGPGASSGFNAQNIDGLTFHDSTFTDIYVAENPNGSAYWGLNETWATAAYISNTHGLLFDGTVFAQNGFAPDYEWNLSASGGQPPAMFSHNLYVQNDTSDVTFRNSITTEGASYGAHLRAGAFVEDSLFLDNNAAVDILGGDYEGAGPIGNFSLFADNVITSAAHKEVNGFIGTLSTGLENGGQDTTLIDNIIAHLAYPNNAAELAEKYATYRAINHINDTPYYDDTIIYNWWGSGDWYTPESLDQNIAGLDTGALDATTIQNFVQQLLSDNGAGIDDLTQFLREQGRDLGVDQVEAADIVAFFQAGFGLSSTERTGATTLRFVPDDLGDGIRWDNRLNWSTEDLPGTPGDGDSVDLGGNHVNFGGTVTVQDFAFGEGGELNVSHGRLTVEDHTSVGEAGGTLNISGAGQVWMDGYTDRDELDLNITGGRFANTGIFNGTADIDIHDGQVLLATGGADMILRNGTRLEIHGDEAEVGFGADSGSAPAVMLMDTGADLVFTAEDGDIGSIGEINTGRFDGNVQSGLNLGGGELELNIAGLSTGTHTLINVNEIIGEFGEVDVNGLGSRNATINVDYTADRVQLVLSSGSGNVTVNTIGDQDDAQANADLWDALTNGHGIYSDDPSSSIVYEEDDVDEAA